jgi:Thiol-disulfide isomerase and thioredoxins
MTDTPVSAKKHLPAWVILLAGVILVGFLVFLALGIGKSQQQSLVPGSQLSTFNFTTFAGDVYSLPQLKGKKVLVNFWASWCTTCVDEAAALQTVWGQISADQSVVFIGVDYADTEPAARAYLQKYGITYLNGPDLRSALSQQFHITGVPETYLIDENGRVIAVKIGPFESVDEILNFLNQKQS